MRMMDRYGDVIEVTCKGAIVIVELKTTSEEPTMALEPHQVDELIEMLKKAKDTRTY